MGRVDKGAMGMKNGISPALTYGVKAGLMENDFFQKHST